MSLVRAFSIEDETSGHASHRRRPPKLLARPPLSLQSGWRWGRFGDCPRRGQWLSTEQPVLVAKEAENPASRTRSARHQQPRPAFSPELLAETLKGGPRGATWNRDPEACCGQPLERREVGDFDIDLPGPQLARHLRERRDHALGEVAIPLGPGGLLGLGEIESIDDVAALPPIVGRRLALGQRWRTGIGVLEPEAANSDPRDIGAHLRRRRGPRGRRSAAPRHGSHRRRFARLACRRRVRRSACSARRRCRSDG